VQLEDEELRADFAEATLRVEQLGRELSRLRKLHKETFASDEELEMRTNELALAKIVRDRAGLRLSYTQIVAPFGGRVLARAVEPGQHLSPGTTVMRLADLTPLKAELAVPERQVNQIQAGAEVKLVMDADGREVVGEVVRKSPAVDADTGTVRVTIHLRSDPPLPRPGAFARAELVLETRPAALLVPRNAVLTEGQSAYVFVIENGAAVQTEVKTGFEDADRIELIHGLEAGSLVVTTGARALENGAKIDVLPDPHDAG